MKKLVFLLIGSVLAGATAAERPPDREEVIPVLVVGDKRYANAQIIRTTSTDALVKYQGGIVRVKLSELPTELQQKYPPNPEGEDRKLPRPQVYQRLPLDATIRQLEARITALRNSKEDLEASGESTPEDPASSSDKTRRLIEIDRALTQLQLQLDRLKALQQRASTRNNNGQPVSPDATPAVQTPETEPAPAEAEGEGAESTGTLKAVPQPAVPRQPTTNPQLFQQNTPVPPRAGPQRYRYPYRPAPPANRVPQRPNETPPAKEAPSQPL